MHLPKESFWMMCHLIEEVVPKEYFTTMISMTADLNLLTLFMKEKVPLVLDHLKSKEFDLQMVVVELFLTIFTVNRTNCTDIIMDAVLLSGSSVFLKVMLVFFKNFEENILALPDFCKFY